MVIYKDGSYVPGTIPAFEALKKREFYAGHEGEVACIVPGQGSLGLPWDIVRMSDHVVIASCGSYATAECAFREYQLRAK